MDTALTLHSALVKVDALWVILSGIASTYSLPFHHHLQGEFRLAWVRFRSSCQVTSKFQMRAERGRRGQRARDSAERELTIGVLPSSDRVQRPSSSSSSPSSSLSSPLSSLLSPSSTLDGRRRHPRLTALKLNPLPAALRSCASHGGQTRGGQSEGREGRARAERRPSERAESPEARRHGDADGRTGDGRRRQSEGREADRCIGFAHQREFQKSLPSFSGLSSPNHPQPTLIPPTESLYYSERRIKVQNVGFL